MHRQLMELAGRPFVWNVIAGAKAQLDRVRFLSLEDRDWPDMILDQHAGIVDRIAALHRQGTSFLIIEHNMDLVASLCNPVLVMAQGKLLASGTPGEVLRDPQVVEAYLGAAA